LWLEDVKQDVLASNQLKHLALHVENQQSVYGAVDRLGQQIRQYVAEIVGRNVSQLLEWWNASLVTMPVLAEPHVDFAISPIPACVDAVSIRAGCQDVFDSSVSAIEKLLQSRPDVTVDDIALAKDALATAFSSLIRDVMLTPVQTGTSVLLKWITSACQVCENGLPLCNRVSRIAFSLVCCQHAQVALNSALASLRDDTRPLAEDASRGWSERTVAWLSTIVASLRSVLPVFGIEREVRPCLDGFAQNVCSCIAGVCPLCSAGVRGVPATS
jgi:hypothetical protein